MIASTSLINAAKRIHLRYIADSVPGIRRVKNGKGFNYIDPNDVKITNHNTKQRIDGMAIPPAWIDVWISPYEHSHLQAFGFDNKNRKQYIYHPDWLELCAQDKFNRLVDFAKKLPEIRATIKGNLDSPSLSKRKVLATILWLLENTFIRIGNDEYAQANESFGLTTLREKHLHLRGSNIKFEFRGKSGVDHLVNINHPAIAKTLKQCIELPGYELFKCIDDNGNKHIIDSSDVNSFLKEITGEETTAKEFRTWGGTLLAAVHLNQLGEFEDERGEEDNIVTTVKEVSKHLRNTPTVCRKYYIHPTVIHTYSKNILIPHFRKSHPGDKNGLTQNEYKVFTLLEKYSS